jgi:hypothetical protein
MKDHPEAMPGSGGSRPLTHKLMDFLKLLLAFAPWILFLVVARDSLFRLKLGLILGLGLGVIMGVARIHRGVILWATLLFFACATVAVVALGDMWAAQRMGMLANGTLALAAWVTIAIGKPFTLDYARAHTDRALWNDPRFVRLNMLITGVWASVFTLNTVLSWGKMVQFALPGLAYDGVQYSCLLAAAVFSIWYPDHVRARHRRHQSVRMD